jgi:hypothetical protein
MMFGLQQKASFAVVPPGIQRATGMLSASAQVRPLHIVAADFP